jgi:transcriptional regulator of heat shock response
MLEERLKNILELVVREYIRTAEPVSSETVARRMQRSLSPASVRNAFSDLTDEGYIEQPHVSGGRVPKARAYRFFVDELISGDARESSLPHTLTRLLENLEDMQSMQEEVVRHLHVLSQFGTRMPLGFNEIFGEPEFAESSLRSEFGQFLDELGERREEYSRMLEPDSFTVFIGEENKIQPTSSLSIVVGKGDGEELFFMAGPTRMPYDRIIRFMKVWKKHPQTTKKPTK